MTRKSIITIYQRY